MSQGQRERERIPERERERDARLTQSTALAHPKLGTSLPNTWLKLMNREIMTWVKVRCLTD